MGLPEKISGREVKYSNCAGCGRVCLGKSFRWAHELLSEAEKQEIGLITGLVKERPYCQDCLSTSNRKLLSRKRLSKSKSWYLDDKPQDSQDTEP